MKQSALVSTLTAGFKWVRGDFLDNVAQAGGANTSAASAPKQRSVTGTVLNVVGKIWNAPNTVLGLTIGFAGHLIGEVGNWFGLGAEPDIEFANNAIEFRNDPLMFAGALTLGNTINYGSGCPAPFCAAHELQHTYQGQCLGPLYIPLHVIGQTLSLLTYPFSTLRGRARRMTG